MPLDMDAMARVIAQAVKEEVGRLSRDDGDIRAENASLRKQVEGLEVRLSDTSDLVAQIHADVSHNIPTTAKMLNDIEQLARDDRERIASLEDVKHVTYEDLAAAQKAKMKETDQIKAEVRQYRDETRAIDVTAAIDKQWDERLKNEVAAMLPVWNEEAGHVMKRLDDVEQALANVSVIEGPPGPEGPAGPQGLIGPEGPAGAAGEKGEAGETGDVGPEGPAGAVGPVGENGADGLAGPTGEKGEAGDVGPEGPAGAVGPVGEKGADGVSPEAIPPTDLQVLESIKALYPSIRQDVMKYLPKIEHKGPWTADHGEYEPGDEVIRGDSTFRAKYATSEKPPHDDWQCIAKSKTGRRGDQGDQGPEGKPGIPGKAGKGWEVAVENDGMLTIVSTDDDVIQIDISKMIADAVAKFMLKGSDDE